MSKDMHVSRQDMALAYVSPLFRESLSARLLRKSLHFPHSSVCAKNHKGRGEERSEDRFFGFVLVTR